MSIRCSLKVAGPPTDIFRNALLIGLYCPLAIIIRALADCSCVYSEFVEVVLIESTRKCINKIKSTQTHLAPGINSAALNEHRAKHIPNQCHRTSQRVAARTRGLRPARSNIPSPAHSAPCPPPYCVFKTIQSP